MCDTVIYLSCPFCGESDFDLIDLKLHISRGWCYSYNALETKETFGFEIPNKREIQK